MLIALSKSCALCLSLFSASISRSRSLSLRPVVPAAPSTDGPSVVNANGLVEMFPGSCDFMARGDRADRALGGEEIDGSVMRMRGEFVEGIVELCWMGSTLLWLSANDVFIHSFSVSSSRADHKNVAAVSRPTLGLYRRCHTGSYASWKRSSSLSCHKAL
jgi:hypothetical protein